MIVKSDTPRLISENKYFFVFDKPSGWITNSSLTTTNQPVLQDFVAKNYDYELKNNHELRNGIVHRLDKETSGLVLVAKTKISFEELQKLFKLRKIKKTYIALVHDNIKEDSGVVDQFVGRLPWRRDRFGVLPGGRSALTKYKVLERYQRKGKTFTLLELKPKTGRTHQIRIHLKHIKHPIVSDSFYAGRKTARQDRLLLPRLFLHATLIEFKSPFGDDKYKFESNLPNDLVLHLDTYQKIY